MNVETKLLNRLKAEQQSYAVEALKRPQTRDAFEYGHRVGVMAGYEAALNVLLKLLDEEQNGNDDI
jgi:hypothetical protein